MVGTRVKVTVDNSFGDIVEFDKKGQELLFVAKKGAFKTLSDEEVKQLSNKNRVSYLTSKALYDEALVDEPVEHLAQLVGATDVAALVDTGYGIKLNADAGSATDRVKIEVTDGRNPEDFSYIRAEDTEEYLRRGFEVVTTGVKSWAQKGSGVHRLTKRGYDELILVHQKDRIAKQSAEVEKNYKERTVGMEMEHNELVHRTAGTRFREGGNFKDI